MIKLTIIIPVYNVETYIEKCIDSILIQKLDNYEIVLIDDGSTDNSGNICDKYANKYNNIRTIHQNNKGLSGARNTGIREAKGEYLMFVDSDDFINKKVALKETIAQLREDVIQFKWIYFYENKNKYRYFKENELYHNIDFEDLLFKKVQDGTISTSACNKIVRRDIIIDNNIFFDEELLSEDIDWSLKLYLHIKSLKVINQDIYVYRQQRAGSITNSISEKSILSLFKIIKYWYNYEYSNTKIKIIYLNYLAYQYIILLTIMNGKNCNSALKQEIYQLKDILKNDANYRVKMSNRIFKIFGYNLGILILKCYLVLKNKGIIKI